MLLTALLSLLAVQDKPDLSKTKLFVYDSEKGMTLRVKDDGKVELTVKEDKADKTYSADSAQDFEKKHPDVFKKNGLQKYLKTQGGVPQEEFEKLWAELKKSRRLVPELPEFNNPLDPKFFEEQRKWVEGLQKEFKKEFQKRFGDPDENVPPAPAPPAPPAPPAGREFGVKIDSVGETLRDQLSLKEGEGVLVGEVKPGSVAEKSGLKQHDIILKLDGQAVGDKWAFRKDVLKALEKPEFEVEVLRGGKKETLKAKSGAKKED